MMNGIGAHRALAADAGRIAVCKGAVGTIGTDTIAIAAETAATGGARKRRPAAGPTGRATAELVSAPGDMSATAPSARRTVMSTAEMSAAHAAAAIMPATEVATTTGDAATAKMTAAATEVTASAATKVGAATAAEMTSTATAAAMATATAATTVATTATTSSLRIHGG